MLWKEDFPRPAQCHNMCACFFHSGDSLAGLRWGINDESPGLPRLRRKVTCCSPDSCRLLVSPNNLTSPGRLPGEEPLLVHDCGRAPPLRISRRVSTRAAPARGQRGEGGVDWIACGNNDIMDVNPVVGAELVCVYRDGPHVPILLLVNYAVKRPRIDSEGFGVLGRYGAGYWICIVLGRTVARQLRR